MPATLGRDFHHLTAFCPRHGWQDASKPHRACPVCGQPMRDDEEPPR